MKIPFIASILYEDDEVLCINKPAGCVVHPHNQILGESVIELMRLQMDNPSLTLIHRLDRETSGVLVLAKTSEAAGKWGKALQNHQLQKTYIAHVHGAPKEEEGMIDQPIARNLNSKVRLRRHISPEGEKAVTYYRVLQQNSNETVLELSPMTGRTHQLRVHCEWLGCPVMGDPLYGKSDEHYIDYTEGKTKKERLKLHALKLEGQIDERFYFFETPPPDFMKNLQPF